MVAGSSGLLAGSTAGLPLLGLSSEAGRVAGEQTLKVVFVGGHPDDPQSGCGGTMALYANASHQVVALFLTRGEKGIPDQSPQQTARIRTAEAEKSCRILGARPRFANQLDGHTEINPERYREFRAILDEEEPGVVFTHWPIDTHPDHRAASLLAYDAWLRSGKRFSLYYYEVELGRQTQNFLPTQYVEISPVEERKRSACYAHASTVKSWYPLHEQMQRFRGLECGCKAAEAFVHHIQSPGGHVVGVR